MPNTWEASSRCFISWLCWWIFCSILPLYVLLATAAAILLPYWSSLKAACGVLAAYGLIVLSTNGMTRIAWPYLTEFFMLFSWDITWNSNSIMKGQAVSPGLTILCKFLLLAMLARLLQQTTGHAVEASGSKTAGSLSI